MRRLFLFCLLVCLSTNDIRADDILKCNDFGNEELKCVNECPPEGTCKNKGIKFNCLETEEKCQLKCVCKEGFFRNIIGECIKEIYCDQCSGPHEYHSCSSFCDNVCSELHIQNKTHCPIINFKCNEKCYCEDNYARNADNECIPIEKCPS